MIIRVPSDYHAAFMASLDIALLTEHGKFAQAFARAKLSPEAFEASKQWPHDLKAREMVLLQCEKQIAGYEPTEKHTGALRVLLEQMESIQETEQLVVDDKQANALCDALEHYTRLSLGQVDRVLETFTISSYREGLSEQNAEFLNDLRHYLISHGGVSLGITHNLVSDDVRNAWLARKVIEQHMAFKRRPDGGHTLPFDNPMRIGRCTAQNVVIEDPEFSLQENKERLLRSPPVRSQEF